MLENMNIVLRALRAISDFQWLVRLACWRLRMKLNFFWYGCSPQLKKAPLHVAVCCDCRSSGLLKSDKEPDQQELFYTKVSELALWCFHIGVETVTVFNEYPPACDNICQVLGQKLDDCYNSYLHTWFDQIESLKIFVNGKATPKSKNMSSARPTNPNRRVDVRFLDASDSHPDLARLTKELADDRELSVQEIDPNLLTSRLSSSRGFSCLPQVVLVYSNESNLSGFPPWIVRYSEIVNMGEYLNDSSYERFLWSMFQFAKTEQRWGF